MCIVVYQNGSLVSYIDEGAKKVKITRNVITIEKNAFKKGCKFTKIKFTNKLKEIKFGAFQYCHVSKIKFPKTLEVIGPKAFNESPSIEEVTLNDGLQKIGEYAFAKSGIKCLYIPGSVMEINEGAFSDCPNLEKVIIANNTRLAVLNTKAFTGCPLLKVIEAPSVLKDKINVLEGLPSDFGKVYR